MKNLNRAQAEALWITIRQETEIAVQNEPILASFLHLTVLRHNCFSRMLAFHLSTKMCSAVMEARVLFEIYVNALEKDEDIINAAMLDIIAYYQRDPACNTYSLPLLYYKGFHAIQTHRINHWLWQQDRKTLAYFLQNRASEVFGVDIHPAATLGQGIMIDHGTGVVIGETAVLGNNISLLHGVTLGGSGKETGDRHPKIDDGVLIGANASILGNIHIGHCAKIGANSVVVNDVPEHTTVVGVPARPISQNHTSQTPAQDMDQRI
ncbi:serine O-acetyltransferase [Neisseriaceae bacterium ESL0693]|nr:serine O-acetyltransferase [Neisseriaceae bacterium ESL0693]